MNVLKKIVGSHYAIERFGVLFIVLTLCMAILIGSVLGRGVAAKHEFNGNRAVYTRSFRFSLTGTYGQVMNVYRNNDGTKVFLLLRFADMNNLPVDANAYQLFLSGADSSQRYARLKSTPAGMFYLFGNTGYAGVYLQDVQGFPQQIVNLYIRANYNFVAGTQPVFKHYDETFSQYNQTYIYFNPGANGAVHAAFLDADQWNNFDMVEELFTRSGERQVRIDLRRDLYEMAASRILIDEYTQRLVDQGVVVPAIPEEIDDVIYAEAYGDSTHTRLHYVSDIGGYGAGWVDDNNSNGHRSADDLQFYMDLSRYSWIVPGGYNFDWQSGRILTGYLQNLTGSDDVGYWKQYTSDMAAQVNQNSNIDETLRSLTWLMTDGSNAPVTTTTSSTQRDISLSKDIQSLLQEYRNYYKWKVKYETVDLPALLALEIDARDALNTYTINTGENGKVLTLW